MPTEPREAQATTSSTEVPRPACGRCEDWTTVVRNNVISPCPACRPEQFDTWRANGGRIPAP